MKILFFLILVSILPTFAADQNAEVPWQLESEREGITTYYRKIPGSPVYALKGKGEIEAPLWKVASVLLDTKRAYEWIDSLAESVMLKKLSPQSYIEYNHIKTPFILKDREFVTKIEMQVESDKKTFVMVYGPTTEDLGPKTPHVRGEIVYGKMFLQSVEAGKKSYIEGELHCDPKGTIPKWIVNLFQKSWPRNTLEGIRKQVTKADIGLPEEFKDLVEKTLPF